MLPSLPCKRKREHEKETTTGGHNRQNNKRKGQAETGDHATGAQQPASGDGDSILDTLPDEVIVDVIAALGDADVAALLFWSTTCRRYRELAMDPALWRRLYRARFGAPLHERFVDEGKDWLWLYRARACVVRGEATGSAVGTCTVAGRHGGVFSGDLLDGKPHGYGLCLGNASSGNNPPASVGAIVARREGHWRNGLMHGYGMHVCADGVTYRGDWVNDMYHGRGVRTHPDGRIVYRGEWEQNRACGYGVCDYGDGRRYEGQWAKGVPEGYGSLTYGNVDDGDGDAGADLGHAIATYRGMFRAGAYNGYGVAVRRCGTRIEGQWSNGFAHGHCIYEDARGWSLHGAFEHGVQEGYAVRVDPDGSVGRGQFHDGVPHGRCALFHPDGTTYEGLFHNGVPQDDGEDMDAM
ncbi:Morn repeat protein [Pandoravirus inopinatum]|uniref:Morn repeat protein n=1 Tax=Pandoravirus inopinatum TaxID=1605721 RepID=A0A0B5IVS8_9VIRU|nr:Morn repeat protein [Pandoravirus inopinatum]AJF96758.1 Morn repeat protein [Pandoravirus inopinatum]